MKKKFEKVVEYDIDMKKHLSWAGLAFVLGCLLAHMTITVIPKYGTIFMYEHFLVQLELMIFCIVGVSLIGGSIIFVGCLFVTRDVYWEEIK